MFCGLEQPSQYSSYKAASAENSKAQQQQLAASMDQNVNKRFASANFAKDFIDASELHRSSTGAVHLGTFKYDKKKYILKERRVPELGRKKDLMNEVKLYLQCHHVNVVKCEGWFFDEGRGSLFIVLEYCDGGDLCKLIERRLKTNASMAEQYVWFLFHQICLGVRHLHENGIVHRDLKTMNILCSYGGKVVKIADLGVSRQVSENTMLLNTFYGTPLYLSPELVKNKPYNEKADMWSLGVILYEMCALRPPFSGGTLLALAKQILQGKYEPLPKKIYSSNIERCVRWLLQVDFSKRPSINQLLLFVADRLTEGYRGDGFGGADSFIDKASDALRHAGRVGSAGVGNDDGSSTDTDGDDDDDDNDGIVTDVIGAAGSSKKVKAAAHVHKMKNLSNGDTGAGVSSDVGNSSSPTVIVIENTSEEKAEVEAGNDKVEAESCSSQSPSPVADIPNPRFKTVPPVIIPPIDIAGIGGWSQESIRAIDAGVVAIDSPRNRAYKIPSDGMIGRRALGYDSKAGGIERDRLLPGPLVEVKRALMATRAMTPRNPDPLVVLLANSKRHQEMASSARRAEANQQAARVESGRIEAAPKGAGRSSESVSVDVQRLQIALRRELAVLRKLLQTRDLLAGNPLDASSAEVPIREDTSSGRRGSKTALIEGEQGKIAAKLLVTQARIAAIEQSISSGLMDRQLAEELNVVIKLNKPSTTREGRVGREAEGSRAGGGGQLPARASSGLQAFSSPKRLRENGIVTDVNKDGIRCGELAMSYETTSQSQQGVLQFRGGMDKVSIFAAQDVHRDDRVVEQTRPRPRTVDSRSQQRASPRRTPRLSPRREKVLKFEGLYESNGLEMHQDRDYNQHNRLRAGREAEERYIGAGNESPRYARTADISSGRVQSQATARDSGNSNALPVEDTAADSVEVVVKQKRKEDFRRKNQDKKISGRSIRYDIITNL